MSKPLRQDYPTREAWKRDYNAWYHREHRARLSENKRLKRDERNAIIDDAKRAPCADCGAEHPPYCMDLHHRDPTQKIREVRLLNQHRLATLLAEIEKCDVLCAICHRKRHHEGGDAHAIPSVSRD